MTYEEHEEHEEARRGADVAAERRLAECYRICDELDNAQHSLTIIRKAELQEFRYGHK